MSDDDQGFYECQVNTEPKMSAKSYLKVQRAAEPKVLQSELRSDAPMSNPQVIPEIQHFLKNMKRRQQPKLLVKGNLQHLTLGDSLSLECTLSGQGNKAAKALFWTREQGKDMSHTAQILVLDKDGKIGLKIPTLTSSDEGTYICSSDDKTVAPVSVDIEIDVQGKVLIENGLIVKMASSFRFRSLRPS